MNQIYSTYNQMFSFYKSRSYFETSFKILRILKNPKCIENTPIKVINE